MELNTYQKKAMTTCMPSSNNFAYMFFGLLGEVGELIEKVNEHAYDRELAEAHAILSQFGIAAKKIRKEPDSKISQIYSEINNIVPALKEHLPEIVGELGDIAWMMNGLMTVLDLESEHVHDYNLAKLQSRDKRGVIDGDGDNR